MSSFACVVHKPASSSNRFRQAAYEGAHVHIAICRRPAHLRKHAAGTIVHVRRYVQAVRLRANTFG